MRVRIEEGTPALRLDAQRTTSSRGGVYDLSGVKEPYKSAILEADGVEVLDGEPEDEDTTEQGSALAEWQDRFQMDPGEYLERYGEDAKNSDLARRALEEEE